MQHLSSQKIGIKILSNGGVRPLAMMDYADNLTNRAFNWTCLGVGSGEERPGFEVDSIFNEQIKKPRKKRYEKIPPGL